MPLDQEAAATTLQTQVAVAPNDALQAQSAVDDVAGLDQSPFEEARNRPVELQAAGEIPAS